MYLLVGWLVGWLVCVCFFSGSFYCYLSALGKKRFVIFFALVFASVFIYSTRYSVTSVLYLVPFHRVDEVDGF